MAITLADIKANIISGVVANYSALPDPTLNVDRYYNVLASEGTRWLFTYKPKGIYYSDGATWDFRGEFPSNANQATVDAGVNDTEFVTPNTLANSTWSFTSNKVLNTLLTGLNTLLTGAITSSDSILTAFGKVQNSLNSKYDASNPSGYISTINGIAAGGDLSGTYTNPTVVWANGYPTYDARYAPLGSAGEFSPVINTLNTPPGSPVTGDRYLIGTAPTGAWAANAEYIAEWNGSSWVFTAPILNYVVYLTATAQTYKYNGADWILGAATAVLQNGNTLGVPLNIGTNDNNDVTIKRNGATAVTISNTTFTYNKSQNAGTANVVTNGTSGSAAFAGFQATSNTGGSIVVRNFDGSFAASGFNVANTSVIQSTANTGLSFNSTPAASYQRWGINSVEIMRMTSAGLNVGAGATPNSKLQVSGSMSLPIRTVTAATSFTSTDYTIVASGVAYNVTLPTAVGITGRIYLLKNSGGAVKTLATTGGQTIDGAATRNVTASNFLMVQSDGSNWIIIG